MKDDDCVRFLQAVLPRLHMRWEGFRKVRRQVCKRVQRRMRKLGLPNVSAYQTHLDAYPNEWRVLDGYCRITISRFYRDQHVFQDLEHQVLPTLVHEALERDQAKLRVWSAGCGSGEEPYTLTLLWGLRLQSQFPALGLQIAATDADEIMLQRARSACYSAGALKDLPAQWRDIGFTERDDEFCLTPEFHRQVELLQQDLRHEMPPGDYDLILCRNLAFTYYALDLQREILERLAQRLRPAGALVIGAHECLPDGACGFKPWAGCRAIYRRL